jgi:hypothetical protein
MTFNIEDVTGPPEERKNTGEEVRRPCLLGAFCTHKSTAECDAYRQQVAMEEHKKGCAHIALGKPCTHFAVDRGIPEHAKFRGMSPAEYLIWSRGGS